MKDWKFDRHPSDETGCLRSGNSHKICNDIYEDDAKLILEAIKLLKEADKLNKHKDNVLLSVDWFDRVREVLKGKQ